LPRTPSTSAIEPATTRARIDFNRAQEPREWPVERGSKEVQGGDVDDDGDEQHDDEPSDDLVA
jgi:hypothetical protein